MLSHFTLKTSVQSYQRHNSGQKFNQLAIAGQISLVKNGSIFVNLCADIETLNCLREQCSKDVYDISFHSNRTTFLLQHNALDWMKRHKLYECLIDDKIYREAHRKCQSNDDSLDDSSSDDFR